MNKILDNITYGALILLVVMYAWQAKELYVFKGEVKELHRVVSSLQQDQEAKQEEMEVLEAIPQGPEAIFHPLDIPLEAGLQEYVYREARAAELEPDIVFRLMYRESRYQEDAYRIDTNGYESTGLCQINGITYPFLSERGIDPKASPESNIAAAVELITYYRDERGYNLLDSLAAYGAGEGKMYTDQAQRQARELLEG